MFQHVPADKERRRRIEPQILEDTLVQPHATAGAHLVVRQRRIDAEAMACGPHPRQCGEERAVAAADINDEAVRQVVLAAEVLGNLLVVSRHHRRRHRVVVAVVVGKTRGIERGVPGETAGSTGDQIECSFDGGQRVLARAVHRVLHHQQAIARDRAHRMRRTADRARVHTGFYSLNHSRYHATVSSKALLERVGRRPTRCCREGED